MDELGPYIYTTLDDAREAISDMSGMGWHDLRIILIDWYGDGETFAYIVTAIDSTIRSGAFRDVRMTVMSDGFFRYFDYGKYLSVDK